MNDLQIYLLALEKVILNFWPVLIITTAMLIRLWRWERLEKREWKKLLKGTSLKEFIIKSILLGGTKSLV